MGLIASTEDESTIVWGSRSQILGLVRAFRRFLSQMRFRKRTLMPGSQIQVTANQKRHSTRHDSP